MTSRLQSHEPSKELLRIGDILAWLPGTTEWEIDQLVAAGQLRARQNSPRGHRKFLKTEVFSVLVAPLLKRK